MPSNKELTDDILALDPEAKVEGLTNPKLATLLKQLRAKAYVASKQPEIEKSAEVGAKLIDVLTQGKGLQLVAPPEEYAPEPNAAPMVLDTDQPEPEPEPEPAAAAEPTNVHRVAEGKSITSKRGVLGPGDEVRPEYFVGGESVLADLIEKGLVQ